MADTSRHIGPVASALAVLLLLGCGALPTKPTPHDAVTGSFSCPMQPINDAGLTDSQRDQLYQSAAAQSLKCYHDWIATLDPTTIPWTTLPHSSMQAQYLAPEGKTLSEAKAKALLVVSGSVLSLKPKATRHGTDVTIGITQSFKGQAGTSIIVAQGSYLEPRDNWQKMVIVDAMNSPMLLPGDTVFLFLELGPEGLYQESFTGTYYVRSGMIQALPMNPFASLVNGKSAADFAAAVAAA